MALVDRDFSAAIAANTTYEIHRRFPSSRKNEAINAALLEAKWTWTRIIEDTSLTLASNVFTYALANTAVTIDPVKQIEKIEYDPGGSGTGYDWEEIDSNDWRVRNNNGALTLQLNDVPKTGATLRLTYFARPSQFTADTSTGGVLIPDNDGLAAFVMARATAMLMEWRSLLQEENSSRDHWMQQSKYFNDMAALYRGDAPSPDTGKIKLFNWDNEDLNV